MVLELVCSSTMHKKLRSARKYFVCSNNDLGARIARDPGAHNWYSVTLQQSGSIIWNASLWEVYAHHEMYRVSRRTTSKLSC